MTITLPRLAAFAAAVVLLGFLSAWAGLVPVAASSGHWPITAWFLHFTMRQSVETRTLGMKIPPLDRPDWVLHGAGHYDFGCVPCHGAPGRPPSEVVLQMTPRPPYLPPRIEAWDPAELFWIVKHGVKFTGMPAWPTRKRDDEVWAMVAFLRRLPELSPEQYRQLARGETATTDPAPGPTPTAALREAIERCENCHGREEPGEAAFPILAGQKERYLLESLRAYARGERYSGTMQPMASALDESVMHRLSAYFADKKSGKQLGGTGSANRHGGERDGEQIARTGIPSRGVPSCIPCHGPATGPRNPHYPALAGQHADYLQLQLELFKEGRRGGTPYSDIMEVVTRRMTTEQMRQVASYYESLAAAQDRPGR